ncbi:MAG: DNA helicase UvrD [Candidatus Aenigmarchaeota archaeon]|nr:DNA helicase UvrD [Candidatus Aenigmarchaeota archaeon]
MKIIADLHLHSRFSAACSKNITLENLEKYARLKGVSLLGTTDFTHPKWISEIKAELTDDGSGILKSKTGFHFLPSTEIANFFTQGGKGRRVHNVILAPSLEVVDQITEALGNRGRLDYDGRPIFGFSCIELVEMMRGIDKHIEVIPAHVWTSWMSCFGSKSGFDSIEECYGDQAKHIHAIETGLSSTPDMNWRLSALDKIQMVSFSDAHSFWPHRLGREATVFDVELSYANIINAIRTGVGLKETFEFFAEEGKYHWDGHRNCNIVMSPKEAMKVDSICPVCKKELTIGVEHRVEELADRPEGFKPDGAKPFKRLIPLSEIITLVQGGQPFSKKTWETYYKLTNAFGNEFTVLLDAGKKELEKATDKKIAKAILDVRDGRVKVNPGFDGVYGEPVLEGAKMKSPEKRPEKQGKKQHSVLDFKKKRKAGKKQKTLGEF